MDGALFTLLLGFWLFNFYYFCKTIKAQQKILSRKSIVSTVLYYSIILVIIVCSILELILIDPPYGNAWSLFFEDLSEYGLMALGVL